MTYFLFFFFFFFFLKKVTLKLKNKQYTEVLVIDQTLC